MWNELGKKINSKDLKLILFTGRSSQQRILVEQSFIVIPFLARRSLNRLDIKWRLVYGIHIIVTLLKICP